MVEIPTREDFARLEAKVEMMIAKIDGATITPAPDWVSVSEAARRDGVSTDTIYRQIKAGERESRGSGKSRKVRCF